MDRAQGPRQGGDTGRLRGFFADGRDKEAERLNNEVMLPQSPLSLEKRLSEVPEYKDDNCWLAIETREGEPVAPTWSALPSGEKHGHAPSHAWLPDRSGAREPSHAPAKGAYSGPI